MPSDLQFPVPFGGIQALVTFNSHEEFVDALLYLTTCHGHNLAIEGGRWAGVPAIWGSERAMECAQEWDRQRKARPEDPYDQVESLLYGLLKDWFEKHTATRRRDMPSNIALDMRRALQRMGATIR